MSPAADTRGAVAGGPSPMAWVSSILVLLALAGLAAYALFSGPTTVPVTGPTQVAPTRVKVAPPPRTGEEGRPREGGQGD